MKRRKMDHVVKINLLSFPEVLLIIIFSFIPFKKRISTSRTCKTFNRLLNYNWKSEFGGECMIAFNSFSLYAVNNVDPIHQSSFFVYLVIHGLDVIEFVKRIYGGLGMLEDAVIEIARCGFFPFNDRVCTHLVLLLLVRNTEKFETFFNIQQSKMVNNLKVYPFMFLHRILERRVSAILTLYDCNETRICKDDGFGSYKEENLLKLDHEQIEYLITKMKTSNIVQKNEPYEVYAYLIKRMCNHSSFSKIEEIE